MKKEEIEIYDEFEVSKVLMDFGVHPECNGYEYIIIAMKLIKEDKTCLSNITKKIYGQIAEMKNITPASVERCIRTEVHRIVNNDTALRDEILGDDLSRITNSSFLAHLYEYFRIQKRISL